MPSRRARKRYRRQAEATAAPKLWGTLGDDARHVRDDLRLLCRAVREGWPVPQPMREQAVAMVERLLASHLASPREGNAAVSAVIAMVDDNMVNERQAVAGTGQPA